MALIRDIRYGAHLHPNGSDVKESIKKRKTWKKGNAIKQIIE